MHSRLSHVIVLDDDSRSRCQTVAALKERDYVVLEASTTEQAQALLSRWPIDLLVAAMTIGGMDSLRFLASARGQFPELAGLLIGSERDRSLEADATAHGARLIVRPYDRADFLMTVAERIASIRRRQRWPRKAVQADVPVSVEGSAAALIDVSYGGLRFAVNRESYELPSPMTVDVPIARLKVKAELVWSARAGNGVSCLCGAAIVDDAAAVEWRRFVDRVPQRA